MNIYHVGKLGVAEGIALVFSLIVPRLFLSGMSDMVLENGQLLWLVMLIYTMIPLMVMFMMIQIHNRVFGDFIAVCQQLVGKIGTWVIVVAYSMMFFASSALLLRQYAEYTLITALPRVEFQFVIVWYAITVGIMCYLGIEALCRTGYIMLPMLVGGILLVFLLVSPFFIAYNLTPWQGNGLGVAIQAGINDVGFNLGVLSLVFLAPAFQSAKTIKVVTMYALGGVVLLRILFVIVYMMVFGVETGGEKAMPLFELTRLVYLNQYIQRIEALFIVVWVIIGLLSIAGFLYIALYLIVMLLKLPTMRPIIPLGVVIIANLAMLPPDIGYAIRVDKLVVWGSAAGIYLFPGVLYLMSIVRKRRKKQCIDS